MNVLIMSVRAGYGHHSTAKAIIEYFTQFGHKCEMLDIFDYINPYLGNSIQDGYLQVYLIFSCLIMRYYERYLGKQVAL